MSKFEQAGIAIPGTVQLAGPRLIDTQHISDVSKEQRLLIPNVGDSSVPIELTGAGQRNIQRFVDIAVELQPGQNVQADMNDLSRFRWALFGTMSGEVTRFTTMARYGEPTLVDTNVDPYANVVKKLGVQDAPEYHALLDGPWKEAEGLSYVSSEYNVAREGLKAMFYMRGELPVSEIDSELEYSLGVAVYNQG